MLEIKSQQYREDMHRMQFAIPGDETQDETPTHFREINYAYIMSCVYSHIRNYTTDFKRRNYNWYSHPREAIH